MAPFSHTRAQRATGEGPSSPCLKAGAFWPQKGNGYHPELHPWLPRLDELMAAGVPEREALAQAMAESNAKWGE